MTVVRVVPSGSVVGTDCHRSSHGVDYADSTFRKCNKLDANQHKYDSFRSREGHVRKLAWITTTQAGRARRREGAVSEREPEEMHFPPALWSGRASPAVGGTSPIRHVRRRLCSNQKLQPSSVFFCVVPFARRMTQASLGAAYMGLISGAHCRGMNRSGL